MELPPVAGAPQVRSGTYLADNFARSAAAVAAVDAHFARLESQRTVRAAVELRDRAEDLRAYLRRVGPIQSRGVAAAVGSALSLDSATTKATLGSVEEINLDATAFTPRAPLWTDASSSQAGVAGTYDGTLGTTTLTATVLNGGVRGASNAQVEVTDSASAYKEKININKSDPLSQVYTLSNGLELTFGAGALDKDDTFILEVQTAAGVEPDPAGTFDGSLGTDVNVEAGLPITAGSFTVNGELITVTANATINSILAQVNASSAGVTASFDAGTESVALVQNSAGSGPSIVLANDTSGFLAAMKLDTAVVVPGTDSELERPISEVASLAGISSGSIIINATSIALDTSVDSVNAVIDAINASAAGVTAELVDNSYLSVRMAGAGDLVLDSNGSGFFETFSITPGTFAGTGGPAQPHDYVLHSISEQMQEIVDALNDLFDVPAFATPSAELESVRAQIANLVSADFTQPLKNLGLRAGFQHDGTGTRQSAFSDLNGSELRRGFRWRFGQLEALFAGARGSANKGALQNLIDTLNATVLARPEPGSAVDTFA